MEKFKPTGIVNLQNFITSIHIEKLKKLFIKKNIKKHGLPIKVDKLKGVLDYYDSHSNSVRQIDFEDDLKELLWQITNDIKTEIDLSNVKLLNKEKIKYWNTVLKSFDYIEESNQDVISIFPICLKPSEEIKEYLDTKYQFRLKPWFEEGSYFTLKPIYNRKDLENIYEFITIQGYLDDELYNFEDFYSALFDKETDVKLTFNCKTQVLVCLLQNLSSLFFNFTTRRLSESGRFLTKGVTVISETNFNTTVSRIKKLSNPDIDKIRKFFSENYS